MLWHSHFSRNRVCSINDRVSSYGVLVVVVWVESRDCDGRGVRCELKNCSSFHFDQSHSIPSNDAILDLWWAPEETEGGRVERGCTNLARNGGCCE